MRYGNGNVFQGKYQDNKLWKGKWTKGGRGFIGVFDRDENGTVYMKLGYSYDKETQTQYTGTFGKGLKKLGYLQQNDGSNIQHLYYDTPEHRLYYWVVFPNENQLQLTADENYEFIGLYIKSGQTYAVKYTAKEGIVYVKNEETELREKCLAAANECTDKINSEIAIAAPKYPMMDEIGKKYGFRQKPT